MGRVATVWEREWTINNGATDVYQGTNKNTRFRLKLKRHKGQDYYLVKFINGEMCDCFNGCWLVPRGLAHFDWFGAQLKPWTGIPHDAGDALYDQAIKSAMREKTDSSTRRLEGELDFGNKKATVKLFIARNAITTGAPLLIVVSERTFFWSKDHGGGGGDDGTAHGND